MTSLFFHATMRCPLRGVGPSVGTVITPYATYSRTLQVNLLPGIGSEIQHPKVLVMVELCLCLQTGGEHNESNTLLAEPVK